MFYNQIHRPLNLTPCLNNQKNTSLIQSPANLTLYLFFKNPCLPYTKWKFFLVANPFLVDLWLEVDQERNRKYFKICLLIVICKSIKQFFLMLMWYLFVPGDGQSQAINPDDWT